MSDIAEKIMRETPLRTRIRVRFEMEWLIMNIFPDREATETEIEDAHEWGEKMADEIVKMVFKWENDGRP